MTDDPRQQPGGEAPPAGKEPPEEKPSPHEKGPPENPPVDDYDLERGKANLDRVIAK